jgi:general secretion pathway protein I
MMRKSFHISRRLQAGFTLVEVVVALAILALSLGVLYQSFGWSARRTASLANTEAAWLAAQSLLAEIRAKPTLQPGTNDGEWPGGLRWTTQVDPHGVAADMSGRVQPVAVTIHVRWGERASQQVRLQSVELARVRT